MEGDVNKAILVGRVTRNPEIKTTKAGVPQAFFVLSTSEAWFDKPTSQKRTKTVFHRVMVYGGSLVRVVQKCVRKGARLYLEGEILVRKWVGGDGQPTESWTCEVVIQGGKTGANTVDDRSIGPRYPQRRRHRGTNC